MNEWHRIPPAKPDLPPDSEPVLVWFEGQMDMGSYEHGRWYIRRLGPAMSPVIWWRNQPEGPGNEI